MDKLNQTPNVAESAQKASEQWTSSMPVQRTAPKS
jgi:hypothetical protein